MKEYTRREIISYASAAGFALAGFGKIEKSESRIRQSSPGKERFLVLEGTPYERGLQHGSELKEDISEIITIWKHWIKESYKIDPDLFIRGFVKKTNFLPAIKKHTPKLLEEVKGISDGSGIDFDAIYTFQLIDEVWLNQEDLFGEHCTSLGIQKKDTMPSMIAQNMDLEGFRNNFQTVFHIKHENSALELFVLTCPGLIALNGVNNNAVGVCVNALGELNYSKEDLPVAYVIRGLLEKKNQDAAIAFLHEIEHASGQNYIIGGPDKNYDFECSSNKVVPYIPYESAEVVYHTNHPLVNDDILKKGGGKSTYARLESLMRRLKSININDVDRLELIKSILRAKDSEEYPICRSFKHTLSGFTFGSTIMILSDTPEFHVTYGPPDDLPFRIYRFSKE